MTSVLVMLMATLAAYGLYIATVTARQSDGAFDFLDASGSLPGWATMFAGAGLCVAGIGFLEHTELVSRFGLQASHFGLGLIVSALTVTLLNKRLWLAARILQTGSPGALLGVYYQSVTLRIGMLFMAFLFGLPYAANLLSETAGLFAGVTGQILPRAAAVWILAFFMFLPAVIGGWRATVFFIAMQAVLLAVLMVSITGFAELVLPEPGFQTAGIAVTGNILSDRIPGVIQYAAGIGKDMPFGGPFTTLAVLSHSISFIGIVLSPGFVYMILSTRSGKSQGQSSVWLLGGVASLLLIVVLPYLAARLGADPAGLVMRLSQLDVMFGAGLALLFIVAGQIAVQFLTTSGTILVTRELILPYILPELPPEKARLVARVALAFAFFALALLAAFGANTVAVLATLSLPFSVQMFPAFLGMAFVRWISRSAILTGLIFGFLMVFFTEPPGLILVEGLFGPLPWGRWPLTLHSAVWGLGLNVSAVLLVSIFTRGGEERLHRDRLHDEFAENWSVDFGGRAARGAKWSLTLIWAFLAIGPGAILGNTFFSQPVFTSGNAALGIPSLWVWQILFWLIGVSLVWWLAYRSRLGFTSDEGIRILVLAQDDRIGKQTAPGWIAAGLSRVTER